MWPLVWVTTEKESTMPAITLPDGSQRVFDNPVSVADVAADIGAGLAKATENHADKRAVHGTAHDVTEDSTTTTHQRAGDNQ